MEQNLKRYELDSDEGFEENAKVARQALKKVGIE